MEASGLVTQGRAGRAGAAPPASSTTPASSCKLSAATHRAQALALYPQPVLLRLDVRHGQVVAHVEQIIGGDEGADKQLLGRLCRAGSRRGWQGSRAGGWWQMQGRCMEVARRADGQLAPRAPCMARC